MSRFARLFAALDGTNATLAKVEAIRHYLAEAPSGDAAWAVFFLLGRRFKRLIPGRAIGNWALAATGLSEWLLSESYSVVGDGAETAALLLDQLPSSPAERELTLAEWVEERSLPLGQAPPDQQQARVLGWIHELDRWQRFTLLKLLTGELRLGVSHTLAVRAISEISSLPPTTVAARLMGEWTPSAAWYRRLIAPGVTDDDRSRPYPFLLASPLDGVGDAEALAAALARVDDWLVEWKWDGIRAQLIKRDARVWLWSRGEELITNRFPEIADAATAFPDGTVLDGEVLAFRGDRPLPFSALQQRIGRERHVARKARDVPVVFMSYDVLESDSQDIRGEPLAARRKRLEMLIARAQVRAQPQPLPRRDRAPEPLLLPLEGEPATTNGGDSVLQLSPRVEAGSWVALAEARRSSRARGVEGLMFKRLHSVYGIGRKRGDWWKWKIDPHVIDAVLIYAQPGSGKRASLLTDYTFGLWHDGELVPVAKAYSGLTNEEIAEMDRWIRRHTVERFGPVRHVEPVHVFELGFEAVTRSSRHRSGVAVRFPRMLRWRQDKSARDADTLDALLKLAAPP
jgi:DNA ligase-1